MSTTLPDVVHAAPRASLQATIDIAPVSDLLARLHADARRDALRALPLVPEALLALLRGGPDEVRRVTQAAADRLHGAVSPAQGRFAYLIARAINAQSIVEFGGSYGVCTLYLAAAAYDNFGGQVISTERNPQKAAQARAHLVDAGLAPWVDLRVGDALDTLTRDLPRQIDMLVLDGERQDYRAVLDLLRGRLRPGGVVLAPRVHGLRREAGRLIDELRSGTAGFQSTTLPYRAGLEFTVVV